MWMLMWAAWAANPCADPCAIAHGETAWKGEERTIPLRVTWPVTDHTLPVIVFSHGLGGSAAGYRPLVDHWAAHGFVVVQPTHADSFQLMTAKQKREVLSGKHMAANPASTAHWGQRPREVSLVLDRLATVLDEAGFPGEVDASRIGVAGHSFGAHTTLMIGGLRMTHGRLVAEAPDPRAKALVVLSPMGTGPGITTESFGPITAPSLMVTGTHDRSPRTGQLGNWRREAFDALPPGDHWLLWLEGAHHDLGGISGLSHAKAAPADPGLLGEVRAVTTRFWRAQLHGDGLAKGAMAQTADRRARVEQRTE